MTGNKRPWKIQCNDYGEENYSYISGWAMLHGWSSTRCRTDLLLVKASAVNLSYLLLLALYGSPLSSKSSGQHWNITNLSWTQRVMSMWLSLTNAEQHSPATDAVNIDDSISSIKASRLCYYMLTYRSSSALNMNKTCSCKCSLLQDDWLSGQGIHTHTHT